MKPNPDLLYTNIVSIATTVKTALRKRGIVIPVANDDDTVSVGSYTILRDLDGFYSIIDYKHSDIAFGINLPQTAAILANSLALGKFLDTQLLQTDREYGYALFEESLQKRAAKSHIKKSLELYEIIMTKCLIATHKKELHRQVILNRFEKLRNIA